MIITLCTLSELIKVYLFSLWFPFCSFRENVLKKLPSSDWFLKGGEAVPAAVEEPDYFYEKKYDETTARFVDLPDESEDSKDGFCRCCAISEKAEKDEEPVPGEEMPNAGFTW